MTPFDKTAQPLSENEKRHYRKGELGPGVPKRKITQPPKITKPQVWEFSAHPHAAERAGKHIDLRLGNRATGVAHSFVLPRKMELPVPGESTRVIPTYDHTVPYMDFTGRISTPYGKGVVHKGRRTQTEVYHSEPGDEPGTKLRFNLYDEAAPEEFSIRKDKDGKWFLHNKTQARDRRADLPAAKPKYKEIDPDNIDFTDDSQAIMPKLDGAHGVIDLKAGRAPRVFSYRVGKKAKTGLIEHTHKMGDLLKTKVPKELDGTILRGEILGVRGEKSIPAEQIGGMLNAKVFESRRKQQAEGVKLKGFPFSVVRHKGKDLDEAPFHVKREILQEVVKRLPELELPEMAVTPQEKMDLLNRIKAKVHPLTEEGVVLVDKDKPGRPIKAKFTPDFDVFVRDVHPAIRADTGTPHDRAGSISYSWTPDGPVVGQLGGFRHGEAKEMLANPDKYVGRVAKVKAMKVFEGKEGQPGALFQPRFKEWHLDKGDIEKSSAVEIRELSTPKERAEGTMLEYGHFAPRQAEKMKERGTIPRPRRKYKMFGAFQDGKLVGMTKANLEPLKDWEKRHAEYELVKKLDPEAAIAATVVSPEYRGKGVGRKLRQRLQEEFPGGITTGIGSRSDREAMTRLNELAGFNRFWKGKSGNEQFYWGPKDIAVGDESVKKASVFHSAFLDELEKIAKEKRAYGEREHARLSRLALMGMGGHAPTDLGQMYTRSALAADVGVRHPHLPFNPDVHAMPGVDKRTLAKRIVDARHLAERQLADAIRSGNRTAMVKAWRDLGTTQHQWADLSAHFEKPLETGKASRLARSRLGQVPGGRTLASGVEHVTGGLKPQASLVSPLGSHMDELRPSQYRTDRIAERRATNWGKASQKGITKHLVSGGMTPQQAQQAWAKAMGQEIGYAPRVAGRVASDVGHLKNVGTQAVGKATSGLRRLGGLGRRILRR